MFYRFLIFFCILGLNGCMTPYISLTQGPKAFLAVKDRAHITVSLFDDAVTCKGKPKPLYSLFRSRGEFIAIPAGKPLSLYVVMTSEYSDMPAYETITFVPETNIKYIVLNNPLPPFALLYRIQIVKALPLKNGQSEYISIRYLKRSKRFFSCNDEEMMDNLRRI